MSTHSSTVPEQFARPETVLAVAKLTAKASDILIAASDHLDLNVDRPAHVILVDLLIEMAGFGHFLGRLLLVGEEQ